MPRGRPFGHGIDTLPGDGDLTGTSRTELFPAGTQPALSRRR